MKIIDGRAVAEELKNVLKQQVLDYEKTSGKVPHLAAILVGNHPASQAYVANKVRACEQSGFRSTLIRLPETITEEELLEEIEK